MVGEVVGGNLTGADFFMKVHLVFNSQRAGQPLQFMKQRPVTHNVHLRAEAFFSKPFNGIEEVGDSFLWYQSIDE